MEKIIIEFSMKKLSDTAPDGSILVRPAVEGMNFRREFDDIAEARRFMGEKMSNPFPSFGKQAA